MGVAKTQSPKQQNNAQNKNKRKRDKKPKQQNENQKKTQKKQLNGDAVQKLIVSDLDKQVNAKPLQNKKDKQNNKPQQKANSESPNKQQPKKKNRSRNKKNEAPGVNNSPSKSETSLNDSTRSENNAEVKNKRQKKREKTKQKKLVLKEKIQKLKEGAIKPEELNLGTINQKIAAIGAEPKTNTAKRRLRKLKHLQKLAEGKVDVKTDEKKGIKQSKTASKNAKRKERREGNISKEIAEQKLQNEIWEIDTKKCEERLLKPNKKQQAEKKGKGKDKAPKNLKRSADNDEADDSDYEVEHMIKADKVTKKLKADVPMDSEDDDESEEMVVEEEDDDKEGSQDELEVDEDEGEDDDEENDDDDDDDDDDEENDNDVEAEDDDEEAEDNKDDSQMDVLDSDDENVNVVIDSKKLDKKQKQNNKNLQKKLNLLSKVEDKKDNKKPDGKENKTKGKEQGQKKGQISQEKIKQLIGNNVRYVVFVGNLPYSIDKETLKEHFAKAGEIRDVRMVTEKGSNKPKGFAYVELVNADSYQKALSLHHSMIGGRRINVLYTQPGHKKSAEAKKAVKQKNFKLGAMRKQGMLAGSVKPGQKRNARRNKAKGKETKTD